MFRYFAVHELFSTSAVKENTGSWISVKVDSFAPRHCRILNPTPLDGQEGTGTRECCSCSAPPHPKPTYFFAAPRSTRRLRAEEWRLGAKDPEPTPATPQKIWATGPRCLRKPRLLPGHTRRGRTWEQGRGRKRGSARTDTASQPRLQTEQTLKKLETSRTQTNYLHS